MATTKDQILNQQDAPEVAAPADAQPKQHNNGGTAPTGNDGNEQPVNNGSAVVGDNVAPDGDIDSGAVVKAPQPTSYAEQPKDAPVVPAGGATAPKAAPTTPAAAPSNGGEAQATTNTTTKTKAADGTPRMSYVEMFQKMSPYKPPTEEELEKERKKEKREKIFAAIGDGIAALSNLFFTTQGAPNAYDPKNSLSAKAQERWDKLKKERDENGRYYTAAYMQAMKNDEERSRDDRNWKRQLERDKRQDIVDERNHQFRVDESVRQQGNWQAQFDEGKRQYEKNFEEEKRRFDESVRQFNVTSSQNQQRINMESKRLAREMQKEAVTFALGAGNGTISIPTNALNASNVSYVFSKLPANVRAQCKGEAIMGKVPVMEERTDPKTGKKTKAPSRTKTTTGVVGYKKPTTEAMLVCIGANIEGSVDAQNALREIGGVKPKQQKKIGLK